SRNWAQQLRQDKGAVPRKFREALNQVIPEAEKWLCTIENTTELVKEGYLLKGSNLVNQFQDEIRELRSQGVVVHGA
ncbi:phenylacetic acid catabolism protein, partial [Effusibacillus consociatus]